MGGKCTRSKPRRLVVDTLNILIVHFFKPERFLIQLSCNRIECYEQREVTLLYACHTAVSAELDNEFIIPTRRPSV